MNTNLPCGHKKGHTNGFCRDCINPWFIWKIFPHTYTATISLRIHDKNKSAKKIYIYHQCKKRRCGKKACDIYRYMVLLLKVHVRVYIQKKCECICVEIQYKVVVIERVSWLG